MFVILIILGEIYIMIICEEKFVSFRKYYGSDWLNVCWNWFLCLFFFLILGISLYVFFVMRFVLLEIVEDLCFWGKSCVVVGRLIVRELLMMLVNDWFWIFDWNLMGLVIWLENLVFRVSFGIVKGDIFLFVLFCFWFSILIFIF